MTTSCDWGQSSDFGSCAKPPTHMVVTHPDGIVVERRPMCHEHATYAAMLRADRADTTIEPIEDER